MNESYHIIKLKFQIYSGVSFELDIKLSESPVFSVIEESLIFNSAIIFSWYSNVVLKCLSLCPENR